jgi:hypothetical protein
VPSRRAASGAAEVPPSQKENFAASRAGFSAEQKDAAPALGAAAESRRKSKTQEERSRTKTSKMDVEDPAEMSRW